MAADPYLAVTLDAKRRIAQVARALAQPHPGTAGSGLLELFEDVWRRKDPAVSADLLAACFGPEPRIAGLLVTFGFLVVRGDGWELCAEEADRLLSTHRQRVAAGKARAASAGRSGGAFTSGPPAADQRATSGGPAEAPAADQLLQPAASSQQQKEETTLSAGADLFPSTPLAPTFSERDLQALWNVHAARAGWARWDAMPEARRRPALARLREHPERGWWETVLLRAEKSAFLRGENDRGFRFNPDTLLRAGRAESVLEGKYDGGGHGGKVVTTTPERKVQAALRVGAHPRSQSEADDDRRQWEAQQAADEVRRRAIAEENERMKGMVLE